jgi:RNA polymerase sigma factor (sigma-70 family)
MRNTGNCIEFQAFSISSYFSFATLFCRQPFAPRSVFSYGRPRSIPPTPARDPIRSRVNSLSVTDNELMLQVRDGDVAKLGILFERHHVKLYNFLVRVTNKRDSSEDLVQEVFFRILKYGHSFRGEAPFTVWMYQLARNAATDHFRKWKNEMPMESAEDPPDQALAPDDTIMHDEKSELLKKALAMLSAEKREVLVLSRYQELKYEEIGAILNCPVGTVKARVHRALKDLKREYQNLTSDRS